MNFGKLTLRVLVGALFIGHGTQKLFGWFGGSGPEGTAAMMESLDMQPARRNSTMAGIAEAGSGAMLVAGLATPVAAAGLIGTMITAVRKIHGKNGPWNANGGWEFNAVLIAALTTLVEVGPGKASIDGAFGQARGSTGKALFALGLGALTSTAAIELGRWETKRAARKRAVFARPRPGTENYINAQNSSNSETGNSSDKAAADSGTKDAADSGTKDVGDSGTKDAAAKVADVKAAAGGPVDVKTKTDIDSAAAKESKK